MPLLPYGSGTLDVSGTGSTADVTAYVCNTLTGAHAEYTNYSFNSLARIGGVDYGCKAGAVYSLTGSTDAGTAIPAYAISGILEDQEHPMNQKNVDNVYLNARLDVQPIDVIAVVDESTVRYYPVKPLAKQGMGLCRGKVSKGLVGRNWQLGVRNKDGASFDVDSLEPRMVILKRKVGR